MKSTRSLHLVSLAVLSGGFVSLLLAGGLVGCAADGPSATASQETFTDSDEPEHRKRATNRLKLAVLYFQDAKYNFALDEVKQAILTDPNWFEPYGMRGLINLQTGDYAAAEASFHLFVGRLDCVFRSTWSPRPLHPSSRRSAMGALMLVQLR